MRVGISSRSSLTAHELVIGVGSRDAQLVRERRGARGVAELLLVVRVLLPGGGGGAVTPRAVHETVSAVRASAQGVLQTVRGKTAADVDPGGVRTDDPAVQR